MPITYECPHCKKELEAVTKKSKDKVSTYRLIYPIKDKATNKIIWKNLFRMDIQSLFFFVSIILLLIGFWQINQQCNTALEKPCEYANKTGLCTVTMVNEFDSYARSHQPGFIPIEIPNRSIH